MFNIFFISLFYFQTLLFSLEVIGNFETVSLDELNISNIQAKIDTGAVYSSLDCKNIKKIDDNTIEIIPINSKIAFKKKIVQRVNIKSSNGISEKRYIISSNITINSDTYPILLSLSNRESMKYKLLIGTDFLKNRFLVDVGKQILKD